MKKLFLIAIAFCMITPVFAQEERAPSASGYAPINGLKMYYEVYGEGKPLVMIHGSYMNINMNWSQVIPILSKERKIIVADMQGHGKTKDTSREFSYENMADDISGLLKFLEIEQADVLGYSMGGGVAFQMAVRHPKQVRRLIVLSGTYSHDGWWPETEAAFSEISAEMFKNSPIEKQYLDNGNAPEEFSNYVKKIISIDLKPYDWSDKVKHISMPIFMLIGDVDGVKYEHALDLFRERGGGKMGDFHGMPKSRLAILPGTSHIGMMQKWVWWAPMVNDFLASELNSEPPKF
jgi:pimeloyl-ACP methyl ester carboxylesterase